MIVRDMGSAWQIVAQTDHGDVAGCLARQWGNEQFVRSRRHESVAIAARRHDDGWALWERTPNVDTRDGRPLNVFDIGVDVHLSFFRAMIVAVTEEDPYAGLLGSMHAVGIYTSRYGTDPGMSMVRSEADQALIDRFITEREAEHARLLAAFGVSSAELQRDYLLLQIFDRLSLYLCLNDLESGTRAVIGPAPKGALGEDATLSIRPVAPWEVAIDPYPFVRAPFIVELPRRLMPHDRWQSRRTFAAAHAATQVERVRITIHDSRS